MVASSWGHRAPGCLTVHRSPSDRTVWFCFGLQASQADDAADTQDCFSLEDIGTNFRLNTWSAHRTLMIINEWGEIDMYYGSRHRTYPWRYQSLLELKHEWTVVCSNQTQSHTIMMDSNLSHSWSIISGIKFILGSSTLKWTWRP